MFKLNLKAGINKQRPGKKGLCAIRIRSTIKGKVKYYPTGLSVLLAQWDNQVIKHPNKVYYNTAIRERMADIEKRFIEQSLSGQEATVLKNANPLFIEYAAKKIAAEKDIFSIGTTKARAGHLSKFTQFKPGAKLTDITPALLSDYEAWCRKRGNKNNTVWGSVKFVKTFINSAITEGLLSKNPMQGFKRTSYKAPEIEYLTETELELIHAYTFKPFNPTLLNVARWFLFCAYSGLRYSDAGKVEPKKIKGERIVLKTTKTGEQVSIKIHPKLKDVIERIHGRMITNQKSNEYLKIIGLACGIDKRMNWHLSRHSFAVMYLNRGGSIEALSKILGHSTIKSTMVYGKITNIRLDDEIDKVFG